MLPTVCIDNNLPPQKHLTGRFAIAIGIAIGNRLFKCTVEIRQPIAMIDTDSDPDSDPDVWGLQLRRPTLNRFFESFRLVVREQGLEDGVDIPVHEIRQIVYS
jgi:hypothetical protein